MVFVFEDGVFVYFVGDIEYVVFVGDVGEFCDVVGW